MTMTRDDIVLMVKTSIDRQLSEMLSTPPRSYAEFKKRLVDSAQLSSDHAASFVDLVHENDDFHDVWSDVESELRQEDAVDRRIAWNCLVETYVRDVVEAHTRGELDIDAMIQRLKII